MSEPKPSFEQWKTELAVVAEDLPLGKEAVAGATEEAMRAAYDAGWLPAYFIGRLAAQLARPQ